MWCNRSCVVVLLSEVLYLNLPHFKDLIAHVKP